MTKVTDLEHLPKLYDPKVVQEWIGRGEVKREILNPSNYCLFVEDKPSRLDSSNKRYRFIRFFNASSGNSRKTHVSVDWEGSAEQAVEKLVELLTKEYDY